MMMMKIMMMMMMMMLMMMMMMTILMMTTMNLVPVVAMLGGDQLIHKNHGYCPHTESVDLVREYREQEVRKKTSENESSKS